MRTFSGNCWIKKISPDSFSDCPIYKKTLRMRSWSLKVDPTHSIRNTSLSFFLASPAAPNAQNNDVETTSDSDFDRDFSTESELLRLLPPLSKPAPNPSFVFHNKLPKSGSTTMKWLLVELARRNGFILDHQRFCISEGTDSYSITSILQKELTSSYKN